VQGKHRRRQRFTGTVAIKTLNQKPGKKERIGGIRKGRKSQSFGDGSRTSNGGGEVMKSEKKTGSPGDLTSEMGQWIIDKLRNKAEPPEQQTYTGRL